MGTIISMEIVFSVFEGISLLLDRVIISFGFDGHTIVAENLPIKALTYEALQMPYALLL